MVHDILGDSEKLIRFVRGNLRGEAKVAFDAEISARPELRAELIFAAALKIAMRDRNPPNDGKNTGWDRLSQAIDENR